MKKIYKLTIDSKHNVIFTITSEEFPTLENLKQVIEEILDETKRKVHYALYSDPSEKLYTQQYINQTNSAFGTHIMLKDLLGFIKNNSTNKKLFNFKVGSNDLLDFGKIVIEEVNKKIEEDTLDVTKVTVVKNSVH